MHHVNLGTADVNAGGKYHEVRLKDSIMIPFLGVLIDRNYCSDKSLQIKLKFLGAKDSFTTI